MDQELFWYRVTSLPVWCGMSAPSESSVLNFGEVVEKSAEKLKNDRNGWMWETEREMKMVKRNGTGSVSDFQAADALLSLGRQTRINSAEASRSTLPSQGEARIAHPSDSDW